MKCSDCKNEDTRLQKYTLPNMGYIDDGSETGQPGTLMDYKIDLCEKCIKKRQEK